MLTSLFSSCCGMRSHKNSASLDERTALLNPDIIPAAPQQIQGKTTEEELLEQELLREILEEASSRFVNIEAPTPFSRRSPYSTRLSTSSSSTSSATSPTRSLIKVPVQDQNQLGDRSSVWRPPLDDEDASHFITNGQSRGNGNGNGNGKKNGSPSAGLRRPISAHTLRTLPRSTTASVSVSPPKSPTLSSASPASTFHTAKEGEEGESEYGTMASMASYRTARDYDDTDDVSDHEGTLRLKTGKGANGSGRKSVKEVWGSEATQ